VLHVPLTSYPATPGNNGLISGISDSVDSGRSASYTFDSLYRLATAQTAGSTNYPAWGLSETYDRYGNRTQQAALPNTCVTIACPQPSFAVSASTNRLVGSPYSYDASGNMTNDGINTLVYDAENHLVSATNGGASGTYTYDGNGLRVKKVSGSNNTVYIFSGSKVIAEYDNGAAVGSPSREYIYSGSALLAKIDSSGTKYYHQDHLSNRMVTDASGTKVAEMGTFPYGESWYNASSDKLVFTTYERDSESGNDYAQARYNVSGLARFSSPDPIVGSTSDPQSFNRYSYVRNTPTMFIDPSGSVPCATLDNRSPDSFSSGPTWGGGPSDESLSSDAEAPPPSGCGGPAPCEYTLAGCGGGFGGPGGGAGLDGGFSGDDSGMAPTFGVGQSPGDSFSSIGMTFYTFTGSANFHWLDYDLDELLRFASQGEISVSEGLFVDINALTPGGGGGGGAAVPTKEDAIQKARKALLNALLQDPDCISFLAGKGSDALNVAKNIPITPGDLGYYAIAAQTFNAPVGLKAPTNPYIVVNNIGAFFNNYNATGFQASILLHELGHATGVLVPDGVMTDASQTGQLQEHNQLALQLNCGKTLAALGQH
jgi:RHS repeat-associated protein